MHNRVSSFVCICAVFSCHLSCLRRRLKKPGARFRTLKTNEARFKRRASTSQGACGGARVQSRASNGQAWGFTGLMEVCIKHVSFASSLQNQISCNLIFAAELQKTFGNAGITREEGLLYVRSVRKV